METTQKLKKPKAKPHYVDNKKFLVAMVEYKEKCRVAEEKGKTKPDVTNYIGECFLKIANHLSLDQTLLTIHTEMI